MRVLTTAAEINSELMRLIRECSSCEVAVAWASTGFRAFELLAKHARKIRRMVVGTHFYQTHPGFMERFLTHAKVRFVLNPDGVFHPKVYLFEKAGGRWDCLIGSPNFTPGGFIANDEMAVLWADDDLGAHDALAGVRAAVTEYWRKATSLSRAEWEASRPGSRRTRRAYPSLARVSTAILTLIPSLGMVKLLTGYYAFAAKAGQVEEQAKRFGERAVSEIRAMIVVFEYHLARAAAPPLPDWIFRARQAELNQLWDEVRSAKGTDQV